MPLRHTVIEICSLFFLALFPLPTDMSQFQYQESMDNIGRK